MADKTIETGLVHVQMLQQNTLSNVDDDATDDEGEEEDEKD